MTRRRHWIIVAICAAILLCVFASSALIAREAAVHHHCVGEDCPICQFIEQVEQVRRVFGAALSALLFICAAVFAHRERRGGESQDAPVLCTLVGRKIRLND